MRFVLFKKCLTGFADVITWEEDEFIGMIEYKTLDVNAIWEGMDNFFELLSNKRFLEKNFELEICITKH